jgi:hypothetical protein
MIFEKIEARSAANLAAVLEEPKNFAPKIFHFLLGSDHPMIALTLGLPALLRSGTQL